MKRLLCSVASFPLSGAFACLVVANTWLAVIDASPTKLALAPIYAWLSAAHLDLGVTAWRR